MDIDLDALEARANVRKTRFGTNAGHGHVWDRPDGFRARCGGPKMCEECSADLNRIGPEFDLATVLALIARAREAERSEEHRNDLADAIQQWQIRADAAEAEVARLRTVVEKLEQELQEKSNG